MKPVISVRGLWKNYLDDDGDETAALRGIDLDLMPGEVVALYGKSGSGKTTLLNLLAGLDFPTRGTITVDGNDLAGLGEKGRTLLRRRRLGFVFQFFNLLPTLTAFENIFLSLELSGAADPEAVYRSLDGVGLAGKHGRFPHELSGGEQQRVAIARAIVKAPAIILADEPTGNLDTNTGIEIIRMLADYSRANGALLLMATHSTRTCRFVDRILRIDDGIVHEEATCTEV